MSNKKKRIQVTVSEEDLLFMKLRGFKPSGLLRWAVRVQKEMLDTNQEIINREKQKLENLRKKRGLQ